MFFEDIGQCFVQQGLHCSLLDGRQSFQLGQSFLWKISSDRFLAYSTWCHVRRRSVLSSCEGRRGCCWCCFQDLLFSPIGAVHCFSFFDVGRDHFCLFRRNSSLLKLAEACFFFRSEWDRLSLEFVAKVAIDFPGSWQVFLLFDLASELGFMDSYQHLIVALPFQTGQRSPLFRGRLFIGHEGALRGGGRWRSLRQSASQNVMVGPCGEVAKRRLGGQRWGCAETEKTKDRAGPSSSRHDPVDGWTDAARRINFGSVGSYGKGRRTYGFAPANPRLTPPDPPSSRAGIRLKASQPPVLGGQAIQF